MNGVNAAEGAIYALSAAGLGLLAVAIFFLVVIERGRRKHQDSHQASAE